MQIRNLSKIKNLTSKIYVYLLVLMLAFLPVGKIIIKAQEEPVSFPTEKPASYPEVSTNVDNVIDNSKGSFDGYTDAEVNDAAAKVKDALIVPSEDNFFVVKFKDKDSADRVTQEVAPQDVIPDRYTPLLGENVRLIKIDNQEEKIDQMTRFNLDDSVQYVETNQIVKKETWTTTSTTAKPNEFQPPGSPTNFWYHTKTKLTETYKDEGCPSSNACGGSNTVIVAILDTGMAFETNTGATYREFNGSTNPLRTPLNFTAAPELAGVSIWTNPSENYTGSDEDGDLICDDLHGADMIAVIDNLSMKNFSQWQTSCNNVGDADHAWIEKEGHPNDDDGHGTFVANMIASIADNATSSFGAAFDTQIMPIKVLDYTGTGTTFTIAQGIRYAVNKGARILNISIAGLTTPSATLEDAINYAKGFGALIIISSGNQALSSLEYPAAYTNSYDNVIAVGATNTSFTKASYSSYGTGLDLVVPVGNGASPGNAAFGQTFNDADSWASTPVTSRNFGTFSNKFWIGTSFAAPQVSSAAALLWAEYTNLTPSLIKSYLRSSATDVGTPGYDVQTGYGILNIKLARDQISQQLGFPWIPSGNTNGDVVMADFNGRLFQTIIISNQGIYTRSTNGSIDSSNNPIWTPWLVAGSTSGKIFNMVSNGKLYQSTVNAGVLYTRYTTATSFDGSGSPIWDGTWVASGNTSGDVYMADFNGRLFQTIVISNQGIYTRSTSGSLDVSNNPIWTPWLVAGSTSGKIFNMVSNGKLYQSTVNAGVLYTRYTTSTVFDGTGSPVWDGTWVGSGNTNGDVYMADFNGRLFQTIVISNQGIYTRSTNGSLDGSNNPIWTPWLVAGSTPNKIYNAVSNNKLYQSTVNGGVVYTRYTTATSFDGTGSPVWDGTWVGSGNTNGEVFMTDFNGRLFQTIVISTGAVAIRTTDGTLDGSSNPIWSGWIVDRLSTTGKVYTKSSNNKLYQSIITSGVVWTRYFIPVI